MKLKNNNKKIIRKLTLRNLLTNRTRTTITFIAIILSTFMIATTIQLGFNFNKNNDIYWSRVKGSNSSLSLVKPSPLQYELLKKENFDSVGYEINAGFIGLSSGQMKSFVNLNYSDEINYEKHLLPSFYDVTGRYPKHYNEIMASYEALDRINIKDPELGMDVTFLFYGKNDVIEETFKIVGLFRSDSWRATFYASKEFIDFHGYTLENNGTVKMKVSNFERKALVEKLEQTFPFKDSQHLTNDSYGYMDNGTLTLRIGFITVILSLLILLSGYLLIYNVFYMTILKDLHLYSLLKTIGCTKKQCKRMVQNQVQYLAFLGIPVGLVLAFFTVKVITPRILTPILNLLTIKLTLKAYINPLIFLGSAFFILIVIQLSCRKPAAIICKLTPIEAIRYMGVNPVNNNKRWFPTSGKKMQRMALYNLFYNKKRSALVFLSLFIGIVTFLCVYTAIDAFHINVPANVTITNGDLNSYRIKKETIETLEQAPYIKNLDAYYIADVNIEQIDENLLPFYKIYLANDAFYSKEDIDDMLSNLEMENRKPSFLFELSDKTIHRLNKELETPISLEAFLKGEVIIFASTEAKKINDTRFKDLIGNTFSLLDSESGNIRSYTIGAVVPINDINETNISMYYMGLPNFYVSQNELLNHYSKLTPLVTTFDFDQDKENELRDLLGKQFRANPAVSIEYDTEVNEILKPMKKSLSLLNFSICSILILAGIVNFINIMLSSIHSRQKEFAILKCIGMTKKQIRTMLTIEGLYYSIIISILILTLGNIMIYLTGFSIRSVTDQLRISYPLLPLVCMLLLLYLIFLVTPQILFRLSSWKAITEQLKIKRNIISR